METTALRATQSCDASEEFRLFGERELRRCVAHRRSGPANRLYYTADGGGDLKLPFRHLDEHDHFWAGLSVGLTHTPSELLVFGRPPGQERVRLTTRIIFTRMSIDRQVEAIARVARFYRPDVLRVDMTGIGLATYQLLLTASVDPSLSTLVGCSFADKVGRSTLADYATSHLQDTINSRRVTFPRDQQAVRALQSETTRWTVDASGRPRRILNMTRFGEAARLALLPMSLT
jgi:hypothetical protein